LARCQDHGLGHRLLLLLLYGDGVSVCVRKLCAGVVFHP
jgi:hypothetical protein